MTEAEKVRPNQTMKGPKMETGRGRQRARQEGAKKQRVLWHALHEAANIYETRRKKTIEGKRRGTHLTIAFQTRFNGLKRASTRIAHGVP